MSACLNALGQFDRNFDGQITISDIFGMLKAFTNLPAKIVIDAMEGNYIYRFLELSQESCTSNDSFVFSILSWLFLAYFAVKILSYLGYSDERALQEYEKKKRDMGY
jgi:hypothetical protein